MQKCRHCAGATASEHVYICKAFHPVTQHIYIHIVFFTRIMKLPQAIYIANHANHTWRILEGPMDVIVVVAADCRIELVAAEVCLEIFRDPSPRVLLLEVWREFATENINPAETFGEPWTRVAWPEGWREFGSENIIPSGVTKWVECPIPVGRIEEGLVILPRRLGIPSRVIRYLGGKIVYGGGGE